MVKFQNSVNMQLMTSNGKYAIDVTRENGIVLYNANYRSGHATIESVSSRRDYRVSMSAVGCDEDYVTYTDDLSGVIKELNEVICSYNPFKGSMTRALKNAVAVMVTFK